MFSSGEVKVNGRVTALLELGAGFNRDFTGRENVYMNGALMGFTKEEIDARFQSIAEFADIGDFIEQPVKTYSSGMFVRLGFSVVAHLDPEILLIDEILAVSDMHFQKKCLDKMMGFKKKGVTMVFVSHSMADVERICDRAMWIGKVKGVMDWKGVTHLNG